MIPCPVKFDADIFDIHIFIRHCWPVLGISINGVFDLIRIERCTVCILTDGFLDAQFIVHALFWFQIRNAQDISAAIELSKGRKHEGLTDFPVHHGAFIQMMHQNKFRREFIIFIACIIGFGPGLAEIQIRLGRMGEIISHLSE